MHSARALATEDFEEGVIEHLPVFAHDDHVYLVDTFAGCSDCAEVAQRHTAATQFGEDQGSSGHTIPLCVRKSINCTCA